MPCWCYSNPCGPSGGELPQGESNRVRRGGRPDPNWALNSAVECHLHTVEVAGSNPAAPTSIACSRGSLSARTDIWTPSRKQTSSACSSCRRLAHSGIRSSIRVLRTQYCALESIPHEKRVTGKGIAAKTAVTLLCSSCASVKSARAENNLGLCFQSRLPLNN